MAVVNRENYGGADAAAARDIFPFAFALCRDEPAFPHDLGFCAVVGAQSSINLSGSSFGF